MSYLAGKGRKAEVHGRGLSLGDAFNAFGFNLPETLTEMQSIHEIDKAGVLRFKRIDGEAIPLLQYEGESEEALCFAFQIRLSTGDFVDINLSVLSRALSLL